MSLELELRDKLICFTAARRRYSCTAVRVVETTFDTCYRV